MGRSVGKARGAESRASGKAPYFQRGVTATRVEEGFFSKFPLDHVSTSVARSVNLFPSLSLSLSPSPFFFPPYAHPSFSLHRFSPSPPLSPTRALEGVLFAFKWQHFNLHAKSARRPPCHSPVRISI